MSSAGAASRHFSRRVSGGSEKDRHQLQQQGRYRQRQQNPQQEQQQQQPTQPTRTQTQLSRVRGRPRHPWELVAIGAHQEAASSLRFKIGDANGTDDYNNNVLHHMCLAAAKNPSEVPALLVSLEAILSALTHASLASSAASSTTSPAPPTPLINSINRDGFSPLSIALQRHQSPEIALALIRAGADLWRTKDNHDARITAMHVLARNPFITDGEEGTLLFNNMCAVIEEHLQSGKDFARIINAVDRHGLTPLAYLARTAAIGPVLSLISKGACIVSRTKATTTFMHELAGSQALPNTDKVDFLDHVCRAVSKKDLQSAMLTFNAQGFLPMHLAAANRSATLAFLIAMIDATGDMTLEMTSKGNLFHVVNNNNPAVLEGLVEHAKQTLSAGECGRLINQNNERGITPLIAAIVRGDVAGSHSLLRAGAKASKRDRDGNTPLYHICRTGKADMSPLFLTFIEYYGSKASHVEKALQVTLEHGHINTAREVIGFLASTPPGLANMVCDAQSIFHRIMARKGPHTEAIELFRITYRHFKDLDGSFYRTLLNSEAGNWHSVDSLLVTALSIEQGVQRLEALIDLEPSAVFTPNVMEHLVLTTMMHASHSHNGRLKSLIDLLVRRIGKERTGAALASIDGVLHTAISHGVVSLFLPFISVPRFSHANITEALNLLMYEFPSKVFPDRRTDPHHSRSPKDVVRRIDEIQAIIKELQARGQPHREVVISAIHRDSYTYSYAPTTFATTVVELLPQFRSFPAFMSFVMEYLPEMVTCSICFDEHTDPVFARVNDGGEHYSKIPCDHRFCRSCLRNWVDVTLNEGDDTVRCPHIGCKFVLYPTDIERCATPEVFSAWLARRKQLQLSRVTIDPSILGDFVRSNCQQCPRCSAIIERSAGCSAMKCVCGCSFSWGSNNVVVLGSAV